MARRGRTLLGLIAVALLLLGALFALLDGHWIERRARAPRPQETSAADPAPEPPALPPIAGPRWTVTGTVTDEDGAPIAGASVLADLTGEARGGAPGTAVADDGGRYEIGIGAPSTGPGVLGHVQATAAGYQPAWASFPIEPSHATRTTVHHFVLRRGAATSGRVVDDAGRPVPGAEVRLLVAGNRNVVAIAFTDRAGRFLLGAPQSGPYGIRARATGYAEGTSGLIDISADENLDVGDIVLPEGLAVEGHVRYADGQPVGEVRLWLAIESLRWVDAATTAEDGSFRVGGLGPERRRVALSGWLGGDPPEVVFEAPARNVLLTVPGGRIRLRIVDSNGDPLEDARYIMIVGETPPAAASGWSMVKATGREVSYFARAGTCCFFVTEAEGRIPAEQPFEVPADRSESDVTLRLVPVVMSARLRIESDAPQGTPFLARLQTRVARRHVATLSYGGSGPPVFDAPPGSWHMVLQPLESMTTFFDPVEVPVEIAPDKETVVRVETPAGGRVRLTVKAEPFFMAGFKGRLVRAEDGAEIAIKLFLERPGAPPTTTLDANRATLVDTLLRPGMYGVRVELPRHEPYEETIRIDAYSVTEVVAEMSRRSD